MKPSPLTEVMNRKRISPELVGWATIPTVKHDGCKKRDKETGAAEKSLVGNEKGKKGTLREKTYKMGGIIVVCTLRKEEAWRRTTRKETTHTCTRSWSLKKMNGATWKINAMRQMKEENRNDYFLAWAHGGHWREKEKMPTVNNCNCQLLLTANEWVCTSV